ncbi:zinc-ribbon domain-containing protein [Serratia liquefaciens]
MALISCKECGKDVSDTVKACPNCGFRLKKEIGNFKAIVLVALIGVAGVFIALLLAPLLGSRTEYEVSAYEKCKAMIKMDSANPENAEIEDVNGIVNGSEVTYGWSPLTLRLQNQYGALVGSSATCIINTDTNDVTKFYPPSLH